MTKLTCLFLFLLIGGAASAQDTARQDSALHRHDTLTPVVVSANRLLFRQEAGRIIYDVAQDPDSRTQSLFELLRKVPYISITPDDDILLNGNASFKVLMNGRPSSISVNSPKDLFKLLPANSISKIEVITNPPAKYDAEGITGLINVITKRKMLDGYSTSLSAVAGKLNSSANGSLLAKSGKFSTSASVGGFWENTPTSGFSNRLVNYSPEVFDLIQSGNKRYRSGSFLASSQITYEADSLDLINGAVSYSHSGSTSNEAQLSLEYANSSDTTGSYFTSKPSSTIENGLDLSFNYEKRFRKNKNEILTFSYNYSSNSQHEWDSSLISEQNNYALQNSVLLNEIDAKEHTFQLDYVYPLKKVTLETGLKYLNRTSNSNYSDLTQDSLTMEYTVQPDNTNLFRYSQNVSAAYLSSTVNYGNLNIEAGIRAEQTDIRGSSQEDTLPIKDDYLNILPSVSVSHDGKRPHSFSIGYNRRIQRPGIWQLNPFTDNSNPSFYFSGNPALKPVLYNNFSFSYSSFKKGFISASLNYGISTNTIQSIAYTAADSVLHNSFANVGRNSNLGLSMNVSLPVMKRLTLIVNGRITYVQVSGFVEENSYSNNGLEGNAFAYLIYRMQHEWTASVNGGYFGPAVVLQGSSKAYTYYSMSARKTLLQNKLTISASVTNPFQEYRTSGRTISSADFLEQYTYHRYVRNFNVGIFYQFGKLEEESIKKNKHGIENSDVEKVKNKEDNLNN